MCFSGAAVVFCNCEKLVDKARYGAGYLALQ